jgi:hypothetical protein
MRSIKPGRGPSAVGAVGSVIAILVGIVWTVLAGQLLKDAPFPLIGTVFPLFGILFVIMGIVQLVYHVKNATGKNRMSLFDIVDRHEEPDPLDQRFGRMRSGENTEMTPSEGRPRMNRRFEGDYCPFCGQKVEPDFLYCPKCGKEI